MFLFVANKVSMKTIIIIIIIRFIVGAKPLPEQHKKDEEKTECMGKHFQCLPIVVVVF